MPTVVTTIADAMREERRIASLEENANAFLRTLAEIRRLPDIHPVVDWRREWEYICKSYPANQ